jgi:hypothetical protein
MRKHTLGRDREAVPSRGRAVFQTAENIDDQLGPEFALDDDVDGPPILDHGMRPEQKVAGGSFRLPDLERQCPNAGEPFAFLRRKLARKLAAPIGCFGNEPVFELSVVRREETRNPVQGCHGQPPLNPGDQCERRVGQPLFGT